MSTLKPHSNGPLYSNTAIATLAVDGWAATFGTERRGMIASPCVHHELGCSEEGAGPATACPGPSSLYQM